MRVDSIWIRKISSGWSRKEMKEKPYHLPTLKGIDILTKQVSYFVGKECSYFNSFFFIDLFFSLSLEFFRVTKNQSIDTKWNELHINS